LQVVFLFVLVKVRIVDSLCNITLGKYIHQPKKATATTQVADLF
jgi:hypothetical protein